MGSCSAGDGALSMQSGSGRPFVQKEGYDGLFIPARFAVPQNGQCQAYTRAAVLLTVGFTTINLINQEQLDLGRLWVQLCGAAAASKG